MLDQFIQVLENFSNQILHIICIISFAPCFISARLKTENMIKGTIEHVKHDIADTYRWTESLIKNMAESQVNYMRSFLETYAPNKTPEGVFKALDAISPPHSPRSLSRRGSVDGEEGPEADVVPDEATKKNEGVDANELSAALQK